MRGGSLAQPLGGQPDAGQRRPQVALDVVGQGLERGDVQDADVAGLPAGRRRAGVAGQPIQAPQEGGQGLAAPRRGVDERVLPGADRRPALGLGLGRRLEARLEPVADRRRERARAGRRAGSVVVTGRASIGAPVDFDQMF